MRKWRKELKIRLVSNRGPPLGRRHSLPAILTLAVCAMPNCSTPFKADGAAGAWRFGRLGFKGARPAAVATLHLVFKRLDREAFETALQEWAQEELGDRAQAVDIDGKSLRGIHGEELPGVQLAIWAGGLCMPSVIDTALMLGDQAWQGARGRTRLGKGTQRTLMDLHRVTGRRYGRCCVERKVTRKGATRKELAYSPPAAFFVQMRSPLQGHCISLR